MSILHRSLSIFELRNLIKNHDYPDFWSLLIKASVRRIRIKIKNEEKVLPEEPKDMPENAGERIEEIF